MTDLVQNPKKDRKHIKLILGLLFDGIGLLSYTVPFLGEGIDVIWAPISGLLLAYMYKGTIGKVAGIFGFLEEIIPMLDFIPTFTITWVYTYIIKSDDKK
ncbi:hypothetical protein [Flavobacterium sp.]|jgi:hypothetical protein|uniref:hypothetical protein n=1 Tax=Flavobacterium sp. TaxID=239 RepID=UPI0037C03DEE